MDIKVNKELLQKIMNLSKLEVSPAECSSFLEDFRNILLEMEKINNISGGMSSAFTVYQQVSNQYATSKKLDYSAEDILGMFPLSDSGVPMTPPILEGSDEKADD